MINRVMVLPDVQARKGVPTNHLLAAGNYMIKHKPDLVYCVGDFWDMPSLNRYATNLELEGSRIKGDLDAGKEAMMLFLKPLKDMQKKQKANKKGVYKPRLIFTTGNHEPSVRIPRYIEQYPILGGILIDDSTKWLESLGWEVYDYLDIAIIEGIRVSHYFQNPHSAVGSPLSGTVDTMLKNMGVSFICGHKQGLRMGKHYLSDGTMRIGIQCGSFYQHEERFMGKQANNHWHGIIILNEVQDGSGDICEVSLNYLLKNYL